MIATLAVWPARQIQGVRKLALKSTNMIEYRAIVKTLSSSFLKIHFFIGDAIWPSTFSMPSGKIDVPLSIEMGMIAATR